MDALMPTGLLTSHSCHCPWDKIQTEAPKALPQPGPLTPPSSHPATACPSFVWLHNAESIPASGHLHLLIPLSGKVFTRIANGWFSSVAFSLEVPTPKALPLTSRSAHALSNPSRARSTICNCLAYLRGTWLLPPDENPEGTVGGTG